MAQFGRALRSGRRGREFESRHFDQEKRQVSTETCRFSMISVLPRTDDISSIWYPLSADDICLRHMKGTDIISCLRRKYIIRRKPYIILRQQYIMMHKAYIRRPFLLAFLLLHLNYQPCGYQSPSPTELSEVGGKACDAPPVAEEANRVWYSSCYRHRNLRLWLR